MNGSTLETTNLLLGIMAGVAVLEAIVLIGLAVGGFMVYRRAMRTVEELEKRQIAPLREKVDAILADVQAVTARVSHETERVDQAIHTTIDRVDETAERVRHTVRDKAAHVVGIARGVRAVIMSILTSETRHKPTATAAGQL